MLQVYHILKKVSQNYAGKNTKNNWYTFNFLTSNCDQHQIPPPTMSPVN